MSSLLHLKITANEQGFMQVQSQLSGWFMQLVLLVLAWGVLHHLLSGIRFLFIDFDIGVQKGSARTTAWIVTITAAVVVLIAGAVVLGVAS